MLQAASSDSDNTLFSHRIAMIPPSAVNAIRALQGMGNAVRGVKDAAGYVTTDIDDDGIWNTPTALGLIGAGA